MMRLRRRVAVVRVAYETSEDFRSNRRELKAKNQAIGFHEISGIKVLNVTEEKGVRG